jgi:hypothetical protein
MDAIALKKLKTEFDSEMKLLLQAIDAFPWENETAYCHWLAQAYYMVKHTTRFASFAASRIDFKDERLHKSLLQHLREEVGHEMLALKDLKSMGWTLNETPEMMETKFMIQNQYYWIAKSPYTHYGFIWVLEALAVLRGKELVKRMSKHHPENCFSFIDVHAEEDVDHSDAIVAQISEFKTEDLIMLRENMLQTFYLYAEMLSHIAAKSKKHQKAA